MKKNIELYKEKAGTQSIPQKLKANRKNRRAPTTSKFGSPAVIGFPLDR